MADNAVNIDVLARADARARRDADWVERPGRTASGCYFYRRCDGALFRTRPPEIDDESVTVHHMVDGHIDAPLKVYLDLTNRCNLQCTHCITDSGPWADTSLEMSTTRILGLIDELAAMGVLELGVAGGEPFLHPEWERILRHADAAGLNLIVTTNGILLEDHVLEVMVELNPLDIRVSFDGGPEFHDAVRGSRTYQRSMRNIGRIVAAGCRSTARLTLCRGADEELPQLFDDLVRNGVPSIKVAMAKAAGRGATDSGRHLVRPIPDPSAAEMLADLGRRSGLRVVLANDDFPHALDDGVLSKLRDVENPTCGAGTDTAYITPQGQLLGCSALPSQEMGELVTQTFDEVWTGRHATEFRAVVDESDSRRVCDMFNAPATVKLSIPTRRRSES